MLHHLLATHSLRNDLHTHMTDLIHWLNTKLPDYINFRDIQTWTLFLTRTVDILHPLCALVHGLCLCLLDGLEIMTGGSPRADASSVRDECVKYFQDQIGHKCNCLSWIVNGSEVFIAEDSDKISVGDFSLAVAKCKRSSGVGEPRYYSTEPPTIRQNLFKVLRGLQIEKPILLEGPPGIGKSALVMALAQLSGNSLIRINLSDQTELSDLFGRDVPDETLGSKLGRFVWQDGPFLSALKSGCWILLDEMNLATQSVLEGLNACLDFREEVYIPELNKRFKVQKTSRIFATQNPYKDGSDRKGLPKSFLNRFVKVCMTALNDLDMAQICGKKFPTLGQGRITKLIAVVSQLNKIFVSPIGQTINLRDMERWCHGMGPFLSDSRDTERDTEEARMSWVMSDMLFLSRYRNEETRRDMRKCLDDYFTSPSEEDTMCFSIDEDEVRIGSATCRRQAATASPSVQDLSLMHEQYPCLQSLLHCVRNNWIPLLVGSQRIGKRAMIRILAGCLGTKLTCLNLHTLTDTTDMLGGYEQTDHLSLVTKVKLLLLQREEDLFRQQSSAWDNERLLRRYRCVGLFQAEMDCNDLGRCIKAVQAFGHFVEQTYSVNSERFRQLIEQLESQNHGSSFEWMDGVLVEAIQNGHWILLDDANLCPASVLDRLNGLLETDGSLVLSEAGCRDGTLRTIAPHKDFRLFVAMDPKFGEVSSAMR